MDISFILSADEILTLISLMPGQTGPGKKFCDEALPNAVICDLTGLIDKKLARMVGDELELAPVIHMVADAVARATSAELLGETWEVHSPWISLQCETYPFREGDWRITPLKYEEAATP